MLPLSSRMFHSAASHASVLPSFTQFKKIIFFIQYYPSFSCNRGWSFPKCLKWSIFRLNSLILKFISNFIDTLGAYLQYLQNDTPINWANRWWRSRITTTVQMLTRREIQFFHNNHNFRVTRPQSPFTVSHHENILINFPLSPPATPAPQVSWLFHGAKLFWSIKNLSSIHCWSQLEHNLQKENINQVVNLWFSCKPHRNQLHYPFLWPAKSEAFFSGELYWKIFR